MKTLTVSEICQHNDLSVKTAEKALASLQSMGLVTGFVPGDVNAKIIPTAAAAKYLN
ncbi:hypothetical protein [Duganella vulcania]|uniref:Uncharacterized protein n=1 Tax=Duganella vulcania TaxID=2692166 RepID=A0A845GHV5_9BURK|nr:hypothetical protein [Duganella vulcania]MYM92628.1 hypothetical protein [Duganella vulcania]